MQPERTGGHLARQIRGESGGSVQLFDGAAATVSVAQLSSYDVVVAIGDCSWLDPVAMGDNLTDFQDGGGVVVGAGSDWRAATGSTLSGHWISAGYSPYEVGSSPAFTYDTVGCQGVKLRRHRSLPRGEMNGRQRLSSHRSGRRQL